MSTSDAALDLTPMLRPERAALLELLRDLSADDWERPTECPAWNVKGVALHILGDDLSLLTRQRDSSTNSLTLFAADHPGMSFRSLLDGFNEQWVTASMFLSTELVVDLLELAGDRSETFYGDIDLMSVSREPVQFFAQTEPSPYWQVIAREYIERFVHQSQIRRAVGADELRGELVTWAARVIAHVLAAWMRDYAPPAGSALELDFGRGVGSWTCERTGDDWVVHEARENRAPDARIAVASAATVAMLSRGMAQEVAAGSLTVAGDAALARGALDIIAPLLGRPGA